MSRLSSPVPSLPRRQKQDFPSEGTLSWAHLCHLPADGPPAPLPAQPKRTKAVQPPKVRRGRDLRSSAAIPHLTGGASSPGGVTVTCSVNNVAMRQQVQTMCLSAGSPPPSLPLESSPEFLGWWLSVSVNGTGRSIFKRQHNSLSFEVGGDACRVP